MPLVHVDLTQVKSPQPMPALLEAMQTVKRLRHHGRIGRKEFLRRWKALRFVLQQTKEYQHFRIVVMQRTEHLCTCGAKAVEVHHLVRVVDAPSMCVDPSNGVAVCRKCHAKLTKAQHSPNPTQPKKINPR